MRPELPGAAPWRNRARMKPGDMLAGFILIAALLCSVLAPWLAPYDPNEIHMAERLAPLSADHWLGTDTLGRDVFSRILYGGRVCLVLALAVTAATMLIGLLIGTAAGYWGGWLDDAVQCLVSIFQGLPGLTLMLAIAGTLGPGVKSLFIALIMTSWPDFSRVVRGETMKLREEPYVEGIRALGAGHGYIVTRHILPNMLGPFIVLFTIRVGRVILSIASLSFLGLGLQPPTPDWGVMVNDARALFRSYPHLLIAPGLCIAAVSLSINWLGDRLRDRLDARNVNERSLL
ncbi:Glutathione transport system permease protein GsiD [Paenibacillus solanacearum]|uniref:Glutathione transport system permease protein GsiD n=2 Tax=Paenibacillus solanacearum TaxID=2048548 RepID=A0A916NJM3_9BACL|nr:Glutathione transport system permease protein GsiD [Paenibacillus solanacearum]